jgi:probable phosphoglycerate mutase
VRHGQTAANAAGRWQGRREDGPLTDEGRRQVDAVAARLRARGSWVAVWASPLGRAWESARRVAAALGALRVRPDADLVEYDFGAWDGLTPAELRARGFWGEVARDPEFAPPGGEPFAGAARRAAAALGRIAAESAGRAAIVVSHGLVLGAALALLLEGDPRSAPRYALANGGLAELEVGADVRLVHLDPVAA